MNIASSHGRNKRSLSTISRLPYGLFPDMEDTIMAVEDACRDMDREIQRIENHVNALLENADSDPRVHCVQIDLNPDIQVDTLGTNGKMLVHVGKEYNPSDINVNLRDRIMTVSARSESRSDLHRSRTCTKTCRRFTIPNYMNVEKVKTVWNEKNGTLSVEAPIQQLTLQDPKEARSCAVDALRLPNQAAKLSVGGL